VRIFNGATGAEMGSFFAYNSSFTGGVRVAVGDVNGDGRPDIITGAGPGGAPHVKVFNGKTGAEINSFFAGPASFTGGIFVAAGDVTGDGRADIVVGADAGGGPQVRIVDGHVTTGAGAWLAYDAAFTGGVRVAVGDVNGDGRPDIITAPGAGAGPLVKIFDTSGGLLDNFFAYDQSFTGGVFVGSVAPPPQVPAAVVDLDGDGLLDAWENQYFGTTAGHSALDDFDHDGMTELEELAFALDPTKSDAASQPAAVYENGYLTITIAKHLGAAYHVETAGTVLAGLTSSFSTDSTTILVNDANTLKVRDNFTRADAPRRFLRVKIQSAL
jgi:hypothetical protein